MWPQIVRPQSDATFSAPALHQNCGTAIWCHIFHPEATFSLWPRAKLLVGGLRAFALRQSIRPEATSLGVQHAQHAATPTRKTLQLRPGRTPSVLQSSRRRCTGLELRRRRAPSPRSAPARASHAVSCRRSGRHRARVPKRSAPSERPPSGAPGAPQSAPEAPAAPLTGASDCACHQSSHSSSRRCCWWRSSGLRQRLAPMRSADYIWLLVAFIVGEPAWSLHPRSLRSTDACAACSDRRCGGLRRYASVRVAA